MTFFVDVQLPRALKHWLTVKGVNAVHALDVGLAQAGDQVIWEKAAELGWIIVSKDEDFFILASRPSDQGRLLWLRVGNCRNQDLFDLLEDHWSRISELFVEGQRIIEIRD